MTQKLRRHRVTKSNDAAKALLPMPKRGLWFSLLVGAVGAVLWMSHRQAPPVDVSGWSYHIAWLFIHIQQEWRGFVALATGGNPERGHNDLALWEQVALFALLLAVFWFYRAWRKARLAYKPGPVDVHDFRTAPSLGAAVSLGAKVRFCQIMSDTQISPPYNGPMDAPPQSILDVFADLDPKSGNPLAIALRSLSRLRPKLGYRVDAALTERAEDPRCGITVTVTSFLRGGHSAMGTEWASSWDEAGRKGAYWALGAILPSTRLGKKAPWRRWHEREMPRGLFEAFNEGKRLQDSRHLDEALELYEKALELDPTNANLRLTVGSAQEELGLLLEALETYHGALGIGEGKGYDDKYTWSKGLKRYRHLVRRFGYLRKRPEILELRFRYAATLGYAERIAERWTTRRRGARSKAKEKMKERLKNVLEERYWRAVVGFPLPHELARQCDQHESNDQELEEEKARKWIWTVLSSDNEPAIRVVLQLAACQEMYRLHTDRIIASLLSFRLPGRGRKTRLTRRTVRLFRYIWAPLRLKAAWTHWEEKGFFRPCPDGQTPKWPLEKASPGLGKWWRDRALHRTAKAAHWPMPAAQLAKTVGPQLQRRRGDRIAFMDLYNAACIYGYALSRYVDGPGRWSGTADGSSTANARGNGREQSPQDLSEEEKTAAKALIEKSMEYLREAMAHADSDVATRKRVWILANDPDLIPLRYQPAFGRFEVDVYPTMVTGFPRPRRIIGVRAVECTRRLIQRGADALAETWHDRALGRGDAEQAIRWLKNEIQTWRTLQSIADTDGRHWLYRKEFIEIVRGVVDSDALNHREFPPSLPLFEDVVNEYCMDGYDEMVNTEYVQSLEETRALNCLTKEQTQNVERGIQDMAKRCENNIAEAERLTEALSTSRPWRNLLRRTSVEWICQERRKQWHAISADMAGSLRLPRS